MIVLITVNAGYVMVHQAICWRVAMDVSLVTMYMRYFFSGAVELLDVSDNLPGLKHVPGVTTWKVSQIVEFLKFLKILG